MTDPGTTEARSEAGPPGGARPARGRLTGGLGAMVGIGVLPGSGRWAVASLIDAVGTGLLSPLTVLYFTLHLHLALTSVGLGLSVGGVIALVFAPIGGALVDHLGAKPVLIGYMLAAAAAIASYAGVRTWPELVLAVTVAEVASSASSTARKAVLLEIATGEDRVALMAAQRSLRNLGFGLGGILAGIAAGLGGAAFTDVVFADAVSYLVAIGLLAGLAVPRHPAPVLPRRFGSGVRVVLGDLRYLALTVLDFGTSFYDSAVSVAVPLWVVYHTRAPRALVGVLFTLNTAVVVLAQVRASRGVRGPEHLRRAFGWASAGIVVGAGACLLAHGPGAILAVALLVVGNLGLTVAEMFASTGEWVTSIDLADPEHRGSYLAVYGIGGSLQDALGPSIVTGLLSLSAVLLWPVIAVLVVAGSVGTIWLAGRPD